MSVCTAYAYVCMHDVYECMYVCMYVCTNVCIYVCILYVCVYYVCKYKGSVSGLI